MNLRKFLNKHFGKGGASPRENTSATSAALQLVFESRQDDVGPQHAVALGADGADRMVVVAGFQVGSERAGQPGQDFCQVVSDGRYAVGAIADGYSRGAQPEVLPKVLVQACVEFLGQRRARAPVAEELEQHLHERLKTLDRRGLRDEGCELGAFIFDRQRRTSWTYLVCEYDEAKRHYPDPPVIAAVEFGTDIDYPAPHYVKRHAYITNEGLSKKSVERFERRGVDGLLLSSDGFHRTGRPQPEWSELQSQLRDGRLFADSISGETDDCSAIYVGVGSGVAASPLDNHVIRLGRRSQAGREAVEETSVEGENDPARPSQNPSRRPPRDPRAQTGLGLADPAPTPSPLGTTIGFLVGFGIGVALGGMVVVAKIWHQSTATPPLGRGTPPTPTRGQL